MKQLKILKLLKQHEILTLQQLNELSGYSKRSIYNYIQQLRKSGYNIKSIQGRGRSGYTLIDLDFTNEELKYILSLVEEKKYFCIDYKLTAKENNKNLIEKILKKLEE